MKRLLLLAFVGLALSLGITLPAHAQLLSEIRSGGR